MSNFITEYNRVKNNINNAYNTIINKGGITSDNRNSANLVDAINTIGNINLQAGLSNIRYLINDTTLITETDSEGYYIKNGTGSIYIRFTAITDIASLNIDYKYALGSGNTMIITELDSTQTKYSRTQGSGTGTLTYTNISAGEHYIRCQINSILGGTIFVGFKNLNNITTSNDILQGKQAYINGEIITGSIPVYENINIRPGTTIQSLNTGYYNNVNIDNSDDSINMYLYDNYTTVLSSITPTLTTNIAYTAYDILMPRRNSTYTGAYDSLNLNRCVNNGYSINNVSYASTTSLILMNPIKISASTPHTGMFKAGNQLSSISNLHYLSIFGSCDNLFSSCQNLQTLDFTNATFNNITDFSYVFSWCNNLSTITNLKINLKPGIYNNSIFFDVANSSYKGMIPIVQTFYGTSINSLSILKEWNLAGPAYFENTFSVCNQLTKLNLQNWNLGNTHNINCLFGTGISATEINFSNWNAPMLTNLVWWTNSISTILNTSATNTITIENMNFPQLQSAIFTWNSTYSTIVDMHMNNWNVSNLSSLRLLFGKTVRPTNLYIANWNIDNCTSLYNTINNQCQLLYAPNLNAPNLTNVSTLFQNTGSYSALINNCNLHNLHVSSLTNLRSNVSKLFLTRVRFK